MKHYLLALALICFGSFAYAATETIEQPIASFAAPEAISISTYAYTLALSTTARTVPGLTALLIDNPASNSATVYGHIGNCTSTDVSTVTVKGPIEIAPSSNGGYIGVAADACLWLISKHTSSEAVTAQGISQRR